MRLSGGSSRCSGTAEFFNNGVWGTVCSFYWDTNDASVACKQLNCGKVHKITSNNDFGQTTGPIQIDQLECSGQELNLAQCRQRSFTDRTCNATAIAGVVCTGGRIEAKVSEAKPQDQQFLDGCFSVTHRKFGGAACRR